MPNKSTEPQETPANKPTLSSQNKKSAITGIAIGAVGMLLIGTIIFGATGLARHSAGQPGFGREQDGPGGGRDSMRMGGMRGQRPTAGTVQSLADDTIVIKDRDDNTVTVTVDNSTEYLKDQAEAKQSDIKTGDTLIIFGKLADNKIPASRIIINPDFTPPQQ